MFKRALFKSVVGAVALGSALAVAQFAAPATNVASRSIVDAASQCTNYSSDTYTVLDLVLSHMGGHFGDSNTATATVKTTDGRRVSNGSVRFSISGHPEYTTTVGVGSTGQASFAIPRRLPARATYSVDAIYLPSCANFRKSSDNPKGYTVYKAGTTVGRVGAADIRRGGHPVVNVHVTSGTGIAVYGKVKVNLVYNSVVRKSRTVSLSAGDARVAFSRTYKRGDWRAKVTYLGTNNFKGDTNSTTFRITR